MTGSGSAFVGFRFPPEVIAVAVRWYLRYGLSYRDVEELLAERGVTVDHVTGHCCIERSRECLAVNLAARRRSTSAGRLLVTTWAGPDGAVWGVSRGADRKICCAGLTRWLNATVPPEDVMAGYEQWLVEVRAEIAPGRLVEWQPGDGWEPICRALGVPVPNLSFPHENSTADYVDRAEIRAREDDRRHPPGTPRRG